MNKRVYNILFILLFTFSVSFLFMESGYASSTYCEYQYKLSSSTGGYSVTFSVTYDSANSALSYNKIKSSCASNTSCSFNYENFTKQDFIDDDGNIICPNLTVNLTNCTASGARTGCVSIEIKPTTGESDETITLVDSNISNNSSSSSVSSSSSSTTTSSSNYTSNVDYENFCSQNNIQAIMKLVGYLITIIKIIVPLLLIIMGSVDFAKSVMSGDDKQMNKSISSLVMRIVSAIIIFFIPTIIKIVFNIIDSDWTEEEGYYQCVACVLDTSECGN